MSLVMRACHRASWHPQVIAPGGRLIGVARRNRRERAPPAIDREHDDFAEHDEGEDRCQAEALQQREHGNRHDAAGEPGPDQRMQELDRSQSAVVHRFSARRCCILGIPSNQPCLDRTDLNSVISGVSRGPAITSKACPIVTLPGTSTAR